MRLRLRTWRLAAMKLDEQEQPPCCKGPVPFSEPHWRMCGRTAWPQGVPRFFHLASRVGGLCWRLGALCVAESRDAAGCYSCSAFALAHRRTSHAQARDRLRVRLNKRAAVSRICMRRGLMTEVAPCCPRLLPVSFQGGPSRSDGS